MIDTKAIKQAAIDSDETGFASVLTNNDTVSAMCDEIERLQQQVTIYEKHGVTCQTFGHKLTGCAECNRDDNADDAMALDTLKLQARQYFELLPEIERLRKDAARYQWLKRERVESNYEGELSIEFECGFDHWNDIDDAIDAAMEAK